MREGVEVRFVGSNQPQGMDPHVTGEFREGGSFKDGRTEAGYLVPTSARRHCGLFPARFSQCPHHSG